MTRIGPADVDEIVRDYQASAFKPAFLPEERAFVRSLYRALTATGVAVPADEVGHLAAKAGLDGAAVSAFLEVTAEVGEENEVRGIVGLSVNDHPHQLIVGDKTLRAWCAIDPLFIVPILGRAIRIVSRDPLTGDAVRVVASATSIEAIEPPTAVMSLVMPEGEIRGVEDAWTQFCQHVHFFTSRSTASAFLAERQGDFRIVSVPDGFQVAGRVFGDLV